MKRIKPIYSEEPEKQEHEESLVVINSYLTAIKALTSVLCQQGPIQTTWQKQQHEAAIVLIDELMADLQKLTQAMKEKHH